jgi:hypothetical protein
VSKYEVLLQLFFVNYRSKMEDEAAVATEASFPEFEVKKPEFLEEQAQPMEETNGTNGDVHDHEAPARIYDEPGG